MNKETAIPLAKSFVKRILKIKYTHCTAGGTNKSRYCYTVWMRHLRHWNKFNKGVPKIVAELGPGNSLGIGFCALLSGSEQLHTLDVVKYWDTDKNLKSFNNLAKLFKGKTDIPNNEEFPKVIPKLDDYNFPINTLTDSVLNEALSEERLNAIRKEILDIDNPNNTFIKYHIPWTDSKNINNESIDFVYSQSVLQYIEDLDHTYKSMRQWLKPSALMSHTIDLSSIGITNKWNSHWAFSDFEWRFIKSGRNFTITRRPLSQYIKQNKKHSFKVLEYIPYRKRNMLKRSLLAENFKHLSEEDISTSETYILSKKV